MTEVSDPSIATNAARSGPGRLLIASNRLPVRLTVTADGFDASRSSGGLAAALAGIAAEDPFTWVGWPGAAIPEHLHDEVDAWLLERDLVPVHLTPEEEAAYYHGISNQVLWPLFHYFPNQVDFRQDDWEHYVRVNERFAARLLELAEPGARVWVHDFHLMLVPQMLRAARPDLEIGFFLHIPFPSSEIYRLLPAREDLLRGMLGADHIGFHTHDYARHFRSSCLRVLGADSEHNAVFHEGRRISVKGHPIGIDVKGFDESLQSPKTTSLLAELDDRYRGRRVLLGIERLDYTKGVMHKLRAFERLLELEPGLAREVVMLQVIVPSRLANPDYARLKREIEEFIGRLNGRYGGPGITPVEYLHRNLDPHQLVALYRFADACVVTPVRDGMNLVAQEFVLCQGDPPEDRAWRGILVLSEFAGAAQFLPRALLVNPWDVEGTARTLLTALAMPPDEKRERMATMAEQVRNMECTKWAGRFLRDLALASEHAREPSAGSTLRGAEEDAVIDRFLRARQRVLFLDYDGTLCEIVRNPEDAAPTPEIRALLQDLADLPATEVHLVSGRHRSNLEQWFGELPVGLSAEHGFAWRDPGGAEWHEHSDVDMSWVPLVEGMLLEICREVPGTRLERKPSALAWHYRNTEPEYGQWRARELRSQLEEDLAHLPVDILHGHRVLEVRSSGIHKGVYVTEVLERCPAGTFTVCIGDDRTDRDMFAALPEDGVTIDVAAATDDADYRLESPTRVRAFLARLVEAARSAAAPGS